MKVLIAHKNRVFYNLLSTAILHKYECVSLDHIQTGNDLKLSLVKPYDVIIAGVDLFGFSAIDAFNEQAAIKAKSILLLDSKEDFKALNFLGREISIFDCSEDSLETLLDIAAPWFETPYVSSTVVNYLESILANAQQKKPQEHPLLDYTVRLLLWYVCNDMTAAEYAQSVGKSTREVEDQKRELKKLMGANGIIGLLNFALDNDIIQSERISGNRKNKLPS